MNSTPTVISAREIEVARKIAEGDSSKDIAATLGIAKRTVEIHRNSLIRKTGCRNSTHAIVTLLKLSII